MPRFMGHDVDENPITQKEREDSQYGFAEADIPLLKTLRILKFENGQLQVNKKIAPNRNDIIEFLHWTTGSRKAPLPPIARRILCLKRAIIMNSVRSIQTGNLQRTGENKQLEEIDALLRSDGVVNLDSDKCATENTTFVGGVPKVPVETTTTTATGCTTVVNCDSSVVTNLLEGIKLAVDELKSKAPVGDNSAELDKLKEDVDGLNGRVENTNGKDHATIMDTLKQIKDLLKVASKNAETDPSQFKNIAENAAAQANKNIDKAHQAISEQLRSIDDKVTSLGSNSKNTKTGVNTIKDDLEFLKTAIGKINCCKGKDAYIAKLQQLLKDAGIDVPTGPNAEAADEEAAAEEVTAEEVAAEEATAEEATAEKASAEKAKAEEVTAEEVATEEAAAEETAAEEAEVAPVEEAATEEDKAEEAKADEAVAEETAAEEAAVEEAAVEEAAAEKVAEEAAAAEEDAPEEAAVEEAAAEEVAEEAAAAEEDAPEEATAAEATAAEATAKEAAAAEEAAEPEVRYNSRPRLVANNTLDEQPPARFRGSNNNYESDTSLPRRQRGKKPFPKGKRKPIVISGPAEDIVPDEAPRTRRLLLNNNINTVPSTRYTPPMTPRVTEPPTGVRKADTKPEPAQRPTVVTNNTEASNENEGLVRYSFAPSTGKRVAEGPVKIRAPADEKATRSRSASPKVTRKERFVALSPKAPLYKGMSEAIKLEGYGKITDKAQKMRQLEQLIGAHTWQNKSFAEVKELVNEFLADFGEKGTLKTRLNYCSGLFKEDTWPQYLEGLFEIIKTIPDPPKKTCVVRTRRARKNSNRRTRKHRR